MLQKNLTVLHKAQVWTRLNTWDKLERRQRVRVHRSTSVSDLSDALLSERDQIPAAMFQHLLLYKSEAVKKDRLLLMVLKHTMYSLIFLPTYSSVFNKAKVQ